MWVSWIFWQRRSNGRAEKEWMLNCSHVGCSESIIRYMSSLEGTYVHMVLGNDDCYHSHVAVYRSQRAGPILCVCFVSMDMELPHHSMEGLELLLTAGAPLTRREDQRSSGSASSQVAAAPWKKLDATY